ncbi:MAG: alpha/beta hydrolase [Pseudomonas marincola]
MTPRHSYIQTNDLSLSYYEWGNKDDPVILLVHATGMHGLIWSECIQALPPGFRIIALDIRGHGLSRYEGHLLDWSLMGDDVKFAIEALDLNNIIGVGHSMGGHALLQASLDMQNHFQRLVLIDPVVFPPERYATVLDFEIGAPEDNPISRRRNQFDRWQDLEEQFKDRLPFSRWMPETFRKYCEYGVKTNGDGVGLACNPVTEASVYMGHCSVDLSGRLSELDLPVTVMRARQAEPMQNGRIDFSASPTWSELAANIPNGKDVFLPEFSHFIPMEDPKLTAEYIMEIR